MKANELRIGNYVYWDIPEKQGITHIVISISGNRINTIPISLGDSMKDYLPIPLTEEWLKKFGFIESSKLWYLPKYSDYEMNYSKYGFYLTFNSLVLDTTIRWVHQLQNLYFALTGEELKINF